LVRATTIFYRRIKHDSSPSFSTGEHHGFVLELFISSFYHLLIDTSFHLSFTWSYTLTGDQICQQVADVALLIDSSSSIKMSNFNKQIQFVQDLVKQFALGPDLIQVSALTFSVHVNVRFNFNQNVDVIKKVGMYVCFMLYLYF